MYIIVGFLVARWSVYEVARGRGSINAWMGSCTSPQLAWYALRAEYASTSARNDLQLTLQIWGVLAWIRGLETKTVNHGTIDAVSDGRPLKSGQLTILRPHSRKL